MVGLGCGPAEKIGSLRGWGCQGMPIVRKLCYVSSAIILRSMSSEGKTPNPQNTPRGRRAPLDPPDYVGQIIDICSYFASLEQLCDAIGRSDRWYLLVRCKHFFLCSGPLMFGRQGQKPINQKMVSITGSIMEIELIVRACDTIDRTDSWYLFICYMSEEISWYNWSIGSLMLTRILQVWSKCAMPLIGQIVNMCFCFCKRAQLFDTTNRWG